MKSALIAAGLAFLAACAQRPQLADKESIGAGTIDAGEARAKSVGVTITGVQHLGPNFSIDSFTVDDYPAGRVGRGGGGGSFVCCVRLPRVWRPGLNVEVEWEISDWSHADPSATEKGDFSSLQPVGTYKATVPVEFYSAPEDLYVHFFKGGMVRVVSTPWSSTSEKHPINRKRPDSRNAVQGLKTSFKR